MKIQIHLPFAFLARRGNARSYSYRRGGACPGLLLACCCALLVGPPWPTRAAVTEAWVQRSSNIVSNANDEAYKVVCDAVGDMIVTGTTDDRINGLDMLTIKYSGADGTVLWQRRYNGPANGFDDVNALALDGSGNVVVTGVSSSENGYGDYYTAKYAAADGGLLWEKRYDGPANQSDHATGVAVDASGNVVVTGYSWNGTNVDYSTAKYAAADGALLWEKRYNGPANSDNLAAAVAVDASGNVVVTGLSGNYLNADYYTAKYAAADGALLWERRYDGPANSYDSATAVVVDGSGNVVVTGFSATGLFDFSLPHNYDYYTVKYAAANGAVMWEKRYNGPENHWSSAQAMAVDGSGNVVVTGASVTELPKLNSDYYTAKFAAADGALLWEKRYNGVRNGHDASRALALDNSGNVVVTGASYSETNGYVDYYTAKYAAADGALMWEKRYDGPANQSDHATGVAVDGSGNVVVTGISEGRASNSDYYTAKYAAADGALLWEQRYNGLANFADVAHAVAVERNGNVAVTGSFSNGTNSDYYTAKYAVADGALLWERRYNGPLNSVDFPTALAVDGSGNVIVTGISDGTHLGWNYFLGDHYTAKYAAANGTVLWEQRHNGSMNSDDQAPAVAVDGSGNVAVTGWSVGENYTAKYAAADGAVLWEKRRGRVSEDYELAMAVDASGNVVVTGNSWNGTNVDYSTAKYAAADGALLWEKRYNGPANSDDIAAAVAVDASGNVVVTGLSGNYPNADYYTAKYAAADGALLWEKRYNGPANSGDRAAAVAVDDSGNVVVTGESEGDYYTAKYTAADGALVWEKRYAGPATGNDGATAVAVDASGNVVVTGSSDGSANGSDYYTAKYAAADGELLWEKRYNNGGAYVNYPRQGLALGPNGMVAVTGSSDGGYATVVYWENLPPVSIDLVPTGLCLRFTGVPGRSYTIERAPAVNGPWSTLATPTAPLGGLVEYTDTDPPIETAFYRASAP